MIKVCHVTSVHNRYDVRIFEKECSSLAQNGYDVYLIVNDDNGNEEINGVKIVSTNFNPVGRRQRMFDSMKYVMQKINEVDADVYHFHDPELLQLVNKVKKNNKKIIFDAHEDTEVQIMDKYWIPLWLRRSFSLVYKKYVSRVFPKCDGIVSVTPALVEKVKKHSSLVEMITNYPIVSDVIYEKKQGIEPYIFFAGGVCKQWCHDRIVKAISGIENIRYKLAGPVEDEYLESLKELEGWEKVDYLGKIPHEEVGELYGNALAGMAINECSQIKGEGTLGNTKLFEVMAAQVPVICTDYRLWKEIVEEYDCGICVDSNSIEQIATAIQQLMSQSSKAMTMGKNGRKAVEEKYNWKCEERKLLDFYKRIVAL